MRRNAAASWRSSVLSAIPFELDTASCSVLVIPDAGASRGPANRRPLMQASGAQLVQRSDSHEAVRAELSLSPTTCSASRAGLSAPLRLACAAASQRKTQLATRESGPAGPAHRMTAHGADIVGEPLEDVAPQPADPPAAKTLTSRKATEECERCEYPAMTARQPGYVMGGQ